MTSSEMFFLKWNDFQENISSSFKEIREDFCDVTLVGEGYKKIEAHKVVLAASSKTFLELLKHSHHSHPLLYMKGIKDFQLSAVVDFMYHGEVSIAQEYLNDFLLVAQELQLKGLTGVEIDSDGARIKDNKTKKQRKTPLLQKPPINPENVKLEQSYIYPLDEENKFEIVDYREITTTNDVPLKPATNYEQLDETINSMMSKIDGVLTCTQCRKTERDKNNMRSHIEGNHIEGIFHPCTQCEKEFRSRHLKKNKISSYFQDSQHSPCSHGHFSQTLVISPERVG